MRVRRRHLQNFIPMMESQFHRHGNRHEAFERRHFLHVADQHCGQQVCILPRFRVAAVHRAAHRHEVQIVAVVHHWIDTLLARRLEISPIDFRRPLVRLDRSLVIARADINVRRHVHDVTCAGCDFSQPVRSREGTLGTIGGLHRMDVVVNRSQMVGISLQHRFQRRHDFLRTSLGVPS